MKQVHSIVTNRWTTIAALDDDVTVFIVTDTAREGIKKADEIRRLMIEAGLTKLDDDDNN